MLQTSTFVHRFVPGRAGGLPITLLVLHGTGGDETSMLPVAAEVAPGTALVSPQGKTVIDGMRRFFPTSEEGALDRDELEYRTAELADFVFGAAETYRFDLKRVVAMGYSNGAAMAASLLLHRPRLLAGAVIFRPVMPLLPRRLPDLGGRPVWIAGGRDDELAPPDDSARLADLFRASRADVTLRWEDAGHKLRPVEMAAAREWMVTRFGG